MTKLGLFYLSHKLGAEFPTCLLKDTLVIPLKRMLQVFGVLRLLLDTIQDWFSIWSPQFPFLQLFGIKGCDKQLPALHAK